MVLFQLFLYCSLLCSNCPPCKTYIVHIATLLRFLAVLKLCSSRTPLCIVQIPPRSNFLNPFILISYNNVTNGTNLILTTLFHGTILRTLQEQLEQNTTKQSSYTYTYAQEQATTHHAYHVGIASQPLSQATSTHHTKHANSFSLHDTQSIHLPL